MTLTTTVKQRTEEWRQGHARAGKTTRRRPERRPCIELLEDRACPSLTLSLPVLTATVGTSFSQRVQVTGGDSSGSYKFTSVEAPGDLTSNGLPPGL